MEGGGGRGHGKARFLLPHPLPPPSFRPSLTFSAQMSLSQQPSAAPKIKDGRNNFHRENTELSAFTESLECSAG